MPFHVPKSVQHNKFNRLEWLHLKFHEIRILGWKLTKIEWQEINLQACLTIGFKPKNSTKNCVFWFEIQANCRLKTKSEIILLQYQYGKLVKSVYWNFFTMPQHPWHHNIPPNPDTPWQVQTGCNTLPPICIPWNTPLYPPWTPALPAPHQKPLHPIRC